MGLTQEQIKLMEENRRKALEKRAAKMAEANTMSNQNRNVPSASVGKCPSASSFYSTPQSKVVVKSSWNAPAGSSSKKSLANAGYSPAATNRPVASFQLVSRTKFSVEAPFDNEMIEIFKKFSSKTYDGVNRKWTFPLTDHQKMLESLNPLLTRFQIQPLPKFVLDVFR